MNDTEEFCICNQQVTRHFVYENDNKCVICKRSLLVRDSLFDNLVRTKADHIPDEHIYDDVNGDIYEEINSHREVTEVTHESFFTDNKGALLNVRRRETEDSPRRRSLPSLPDDILGVKTEHGESETDRQIPRILSPPNYAIISRIKRISRKVQHGPRKDYSYCHGLLYNI